MPFPSLKTASEFDTVFATRQVLVRDNCRLHWRFNKTNSARLGFAISKKSLRLAVSRNRIKRIARSMFVKQQSKLMGLDLIITYRTNLSKEKNPPLQKIKNNKVNKKPPSYFDQQFRNAFQFLLQQLESKKTARTEAPVSTQVLLNQSTQQSSNWQTV